MNVAQARSLADLLDTAEGIDPPFPLSLAVGAVLRHEGHDYEVTLASERGDVRFPNPLYLADDGQLYYWSEQRQERVDVARVEWRPHPKRRPGREWALVAYAHGRARPPWYGTPEADS